PVRQLTDAWLPAERALVKVLDKLRDRLRARNGADSARDALPQFADVRSFDQSAVRRARQRRIRVSRQWNREEIERVVQPVPEILDVVLADRATADDRG